MREPNSYYLLELINEFNKFKFCSPSTDPDEQTSIIYSFKTLVKEILFEVEKISYPFLKNKFTNVDTRFEDLFDAYEVNSDLTPIISELWAYLEDANYEYIEIPETKESKEPIPEILVNKDVFIVHGHDEEMKQSVARVVEKLGLNSIILHEKPSLSKTIIEKFESFSDVGYAIILLSPDDIASNLKKLKPKLKRARQNVILELGFFLGKIGRERVFALIKDRGTIELPSDYSGIIYTDYDSDQNWKYKLVQDLISLGYDIDTKSIFK